VCGALQALHDPTGLHYIGCLSTTICHAFPSKTVAKTYLQAAACDFPELE